MALYFFCLCTPKEVQSVRADPVDDLERERNEVIFSHQGNRNPFIDHPGGE